MTIRKLIPMPLWRGISRKILMTCTGLSSLVLCNSAFASLGEIPAEWSKPGANGAYPCQKEAPAQRWSTDMTGYGCKEVRFLKEPYVDPVSKKVLFDGREFGELGFFEDKIGHDKNVYIERLRATAQYDYSANSEGNTEALNALIDKVSAHKKVVGDRLYEGGVIQLVPNPNGQSRFFLGKIYLKSNVRIEVHPAVELVMRGMERNKKIKTLFSIGRSLSISDLMEQRVENVEIRSMIPGQKFTINARENMPHLYGRMRNGNGDGIVNLRRAVPFALGYVRNFKISDVHVKDSHTESVSVQLSADADFKDGSYAYRPDRRDRAQDVFLKERYNEIHLPFYKAKDPKYVLQQDSKGNFIQDGELIPDMFAIKRNPTYGRTPIKGTISNISVDRANTGYGAVQIYGGDWIEIDRVEVVNGVGVRIENGNGTVKDRQNRSGPYLTSASRIKISNVKIKDGFTGVWLKTHAKVFKDIYVENIEAKDSGTAILVSRGAFGCKTSCRDLTRGRINGLTIKGDISLEQTRFDQPVAEVGNLATYFFNPFQTEYLAQKLERPYNEVTRRTMHVKLPDPYLTDNKHTERAKKITPDMWDNPSGRRSYVMFPAATALVTAQYSVDEVGPQTSDKGYYPVDFSHANVIMKGVQCKGYGDPKGEKCANAILYRDSMHAPDGRIIEGMINK